MAELRLPELADLRDGVLAARLQRLIDHKTKPLGSLGRIESLAVQIGLTLRSERPVLVSPQAVVFAGDHGLAARGVSAFPSDVTWQMVENFLAGGAAISVLARQHGLALTVVDAGVAKELAPRPMLQSRKVALGTADCSRGPAMTAAQCAQAIEQGAEVVRSLPGNAVLFGEMGIGNTSIAALIMARLTGLPLAQCVGRGTGLDEPAVQRKLAILQEALLANADAHEPLAVLRAFGGFEVAMMCGAMLEAAAQGRVIVVDGFIATSALLVAHALQPLVLQRCVFSHQSDESGHARMLAHLGAEPLIKLDLRLGEGSGAALAWPLLESACRILREMASFESAGVSSAGTDPQA
ncbi:nicotinate-nucleotide--dimethylbenzimidazole phosphoribosyltransferase [Aquabacterium parvum]|uniref:nicotinate-nucleotide--dimethylbenzimidazole phosphoribosyltransferase n=1 Tax=Aquabacterium parvum TaxID=70584 RepID=UPI000718B5DC|nr:nicotinate-nucleotide--dimethylbenzimidazole phosphoribosyltransferase [Aquabacterium parvum]